MLINAFLQQGSLLERERERERESYKSNESDYLLYSVYIKYNLSCINYVTE